MAKKSNLPWPETIKFFVLRHLERSGVTFLPADHHLRRMDALPTTYPTFGANLSEVPVAADSTITIRVLDRYQVSECAITDSRGAVTKVSVKLAPPLEWTPEDIWAAVQSGTLAPANPKAPGIREMLAEGVRRSRTLSAPIMPPMTRIYRGYEAAAPVALTAQGVRNRELGFNSSAWPRQVNTL